VNGHVPRWPGLYLVGVGLLLLLQGATGLLLRATGRDPHATTRLLSDPLHSTIHVVWGVVMLVVLVGGNQRAQRTTLLAFGLFYLAFLVIGLVVHHPLGMQIDGKENAFHAVIAPLALAVWALDRRLRGGRATALDLEGAS